MILVEKTFLGFGRYERFTSPKSKHIITDIIHCIHVTNNGASNFTVSPLKSALFTNTVTIDTILHDSFKEEICFILLRSYAHIDWYKYTYQYIVTTAPIFTYFVNKLSDISNEDITGECRQQTWQKVNCKFY